MIDTFKKIFALFFFLAYYNLHSLLLYNFLERIGKIALSDISAKYCDKYSELLKNNNFFKFLFSLQTLYNIYPFRFLLGPEEKGTGKDWRTNPGDRLLPTLLSWKQRIFSGNWFPDPASNALSTSTRLKNILTLRPSPNCPHQGSPCLVYVFKVPKQLNTFFKKRFIVYKFYW